MGFHSESVRFEGGGRHMIGLKRTGKSCRLRWVNYLHPDLKRGKMTPHEEKLVIELHSQWGNRWSRIARRLPGRTDNEIKNYWRTHMRKKAQEDKRAASHSSSNSSSSSTSYSSLSNDPAVNSVTAVETPPLQGTIQQKDDHNEEKGVYSMDDIWKDITSDEEPIKPVYDCYNECGSSFSCSPMASQLWDNCPDTLWKFDGERDSKMFFTNDQFLPCYEHGYMSLIG